jgi:hypothetical protein
MYWTNPATTSWIFRAFGEPGLNHRTGTPLEQEEE